MQFTEKEEQAILEAAATYATALKKIIYDPNPYSFDSICAYLREAEKLTHLFTKMVLAHSIAYIEEYGNIEDSTAFTETVRTAWIKVMPPETFALEKQYIKNTREINEIKASINQNAANKYPGRLFEPSTVKMDYTIVFSDGEKLIWHSLTDADKRVNVRAEFERKMQALAKAHWAAALRRFPMDLGY